MDFYYRVIMTLLLISSVAVFGADEGKRTSQSSDDLDRAVLERLQNQSQDNAGRILFFNEEERRGAFSNIRKLYPTRQIPHSSEPYSLTEKPKDWSELTYEVDEKSYSLADFYGFPGNRGLIVIQDDAILLERYAKGHSPDTRWMSFSVT
ncbi:uncharacterized protein METZ01_LOCUS514307, partial [marine metagenome]